MTFCGFWGIIKTNHNKILWNGRMIAIKSNHAPVFLCGKEVN
nr:MAG TPA: hypothetical protein [Bacteriophage sp.]